MVRLAESRSFPKIGPPVLNEAMNIETFNPPPYLRSPLLQSVLASSRIRTWGRNRFAAPAREKILALDEGVRLLGYLSTSADGVDKGLVILIHGWEGSADSAYILSAARHLYNHGYSVFRLNLRDHGQSQHLNEGLFYATLIDEAFQAVGQSAESARGAPTFLVGFSLGGSFALRIGLQCSGAPISNLRYIVAVSPVLDPEKATDAADAHPLFRRYFLRKWRRSLKIKQRLFPSSYDFSEILLYRLPSPRLKLTS